MLESENDFAELNTGEIPVPCKIKCACVASEIHIKQCNELSINRRKEVILHKI